MENHHIQKYPGPEHLQEFVKGFCIFEFDSIGEPMFVPAWAKTMMAFHYGDQFSVKYHDGTEQYTDKAILIGCTTLPYMYNAPVIADLTGVEAFTSLTIFICRNNDLTSLNINSNTALLELQC